MTLFIIILLLLFLTSTTELQYGSKTAELYTQQMYVKDSVGYKIVEHIYPVL
jgi:hypothetical protein